MKCYFVESWNAVVHRAGRFGHGSRHEPGRASVSWLRLALVRGVAGVVHCEKDDVFIFRCVEGIGEWSAPSALR